MWEDIMQLSPHFSLAELTFTSHTEVDNSPEPFDYNGTQVDPLANLKTLCNDFLEPLRARFGPLVINSGFRSRALNAVIPGSAKDSAHSYGCAADIHPPDGVSVRDMLIWARDNLKGWDQLIDEQKSGAPWLHLGILRPGHEAKPRGMTLIMRNGSYSQFK